MGWQRGGRNRRVAAVGALAVALLWTQSGREAFIAANASYTVGAVRPAGRTFVFGSAMLYLSDPDSHVRLLSATVGGPGADPSVARLDRVAVYRTTESGGIGAVDAESLDGSGEGMVGPGWSLVDPAGLVVPHFPDHHDVWGVAVVVTGLREGRWASDHLDLTYDIDGRRSTQRIEIGAVLCVSPLTEVDCV